MQLVFDIRDKFKCRIENADWLICKTAVIKEEAIHQLDTNESIQLIIYLDKSSKYAYAIKLKYLLGKKIASIDFDIANFVKPGQIERCLIEPDRLLLEQIVHLLLTAITGETEAASFDKRIAEVLKLLKGENGEQMNIGILAKKVFLSPSRLRYLFKQTTGFSLHRYIIWNRIMLAMTMLLNGTTVSVAALSCGFTDSSHLSKMLLQMFGVSPSQFIKENSHKRILICKENSFVIETRFHNETSWEVESTYKL